MIICLFILSLHNFYFSGEHVERKIKLHSPMVKSLKVLEEGFVNRGKKKGKRIKRAKLYYLRDRGMEETRVSKVER